MVAAILGHRTASLFVTPIQVVVCFGICVAAMLIGGTSLKALSKLLRPQSPSSSPSSSSSSSPLTLSQWIAVFAAFQTSSAFVPSLASSVAVAVGGSVAFLLYWGLATAYSAVAGVRLQQQQQPLPADFYSLAGATPAERAFAALSGLGVALFAWSNAFAPEVQSTLREPHGRTMRQSTALAFGLLSACYAVIGGLGYWAFGKGSDVVVLLNMEPVSRGGVGTEGASTAAPARGVPSCSASISASRSSSVARVRSAGGEGASGGALGHAFMPTALRPGCIFAGQPHCWSHH